MAGAAFFWVVSALGEERRTRRIGILNPVEPATTGQQPTPRVTEHHPWADPRSRRYALFLGASAFFAFMQDAVLEPFGGDVFRLTVGETTRFNAVWGSGVLISMIVTYALTRKYRPEQQVNTTAWGLASLGIPLLLLGLAAYNELLAMVRGAFSVWAWLRRVYRRRRRPIDGGHYGGQSRQLSGSVVGDPARQSRPRYRHRRCAARLGENAHRRFGGSL